MTQQNIVDAYKTIAKYESKELPLDIAYAFLKVKKQIKDEWEFEVKKERELSQKYTPVTQDGQMKFASDDDQQKFAEEFVALLTMEVDLDINKIPVKFGDRIQVSVLDLEALEPFMEFIS